MRKILAKCQELFIRCFKFFYHGLEYSVIRGKTKFPISGKRKPAVTAHEYSLMMPGFWVSFSPWRGRDFRDIYHPLEVRSTTTKQESAYYLYYLAANCSHLPGDFAEAGVYRGATAYLIASRLGENGPNGRRLHLFDTFQGMPANADDDPSWLKKGHFGNTSLDSVKDFLRDYDFISYHEGCIPDTFVGLEANSFAFVHIDVNLYRTTLDCLDFFYGRMAKGGVILLDDYGFIEYKDSEKRAADEFFATRPEKPIVLTTGQAFVIKI